MQYEAYHLCNEQDIESMYNFALFPTSCIYAAFILGQCMGRIRVHHQFNSPSRVCLAHHESLQSKNLCCVQHILHHWAALFNADSICWIPTNQNIRTHGISRYEGSFLFPQKLGFVLMSDPGSSNCISHCIYVSGVFALLQAVAVSSYLKNFLTKSEFKYFFFLASSVAAGLVFLTVVGLTWAGVIAPWSGR